MRRKMLFRILIGILLVTLVSFISISYSIRKLALEQSKEKANIVAQIIKDSLTSFMINGVMDKREEFLNKIKKVKGVKEIKVLRSDTVIKQFGKGLIHEEAINTLENRVLQTGIEQEFLDENIKSTVYKVIIPYKAEVYKGINCLNCHQAKEGEVLGAISVSIDITNVRNIGIMITVIFFIIVTFIIILFGYYMAKFFEPYIETMEDLEKNLEKAAEGDFSANIPIRTDDEAGSVSKKMNETFKSLSKTLEEIETNIKYIIGYTLNKSGNALKDTAKMVSELLKIYQFKRVIEKDPSKEEVYKRINYIIKDYMRFNRGTFYEVDKNKNTMKIVFTLGEDNWCNETILKDANECRAKRTGVDVDSREFDCICPSFNKCGIDNKYHHYCIPVYIGGHIGNILQIVYEKENNDLINLYIPYIKSYLSEIAPVLEAKTYMEILKEQTLRDPLTGLYNRRFFEDISKKLAANIFRRNSIIGILMIDIDYFKKVNDTYGHDVGDKVIKTVADTIQKSIRESDYVIRWGGEEFLVLLIDVQSGFSEKVAEKIRKNVENKLIEFTGGTLRKTVSIGVAEFPIDTNQIWECIKYADVALYKAKETGRNKVVRFEKSMWQSEEY